MTGYNTAAPVVVKKKRSRKKWIFIIGAIFLLLIIILALSNSGGEKATAVTTDKVESGEIISQVNATGRVKPKGEVNIQAEIYEIIVEIPVEEGDTVKAGDLLVRLKQTSYQYAVDNARAELKTARANYEKAVSNRDYWQFKLDQAQGLHERGLASDEALITAKDQFISAKTAVDSYDQQIKIAEINLEQQLDYFAKTEIVSPIDGVITALNYEVGERTMIASPNVAGAIIMTVADLSILEVEVDVDETDIKDVKIGQRADISVDAFPDTVFAGVVTSVGASAQVSGSSYSEEVTDFLVKVQFLEKYEYIKPNLTAEVDIVTSKVEDARHVPIQAIVALDELPGSKDSTEKSKDNKKNSKKELFEGVFIVDNGKARFKQVELGIQDQTNIQIISGLDGVDEVISGPYNALRKLDDGDIVRVDNIRKD